VTGSVLPGAASAEGELGHAGPRLGWDSYLITQACTEDREEAVYDIHAMAA